MKHWILSREGSLSIILVIWLFNSCVLKLKYASLVDIFKNYFRCFKDKQGHLLIAPLLNYMILPIILAGIIARENPISKEIQNILTVMHGFLFHHLFLFTNPILQLPTLHIMCIVSLQIISKHCHQIRVICLIHTNIEVLRCPTSFCHTTCIEMLK